MNWTASSLQQPLASIASATKWHRCPGNHSGYVRSLRRRATMLPGLAFPVLSVYVVPRAAPVGLLTEGGATCGIEGRKQGDIDGKPRTAPQWDARSDDCEAAVVDLIDRDVEVSKPEV